MSNPVRPKPKWNIYKTNPELLEALDTAFREVLDPELGLNIMELGLVRDVIVNDKQGHVRMMMTTPFCPYAPALLESTRAKAEKVLQRPTTIEFLMEAWDPTFMEEGVGADWGFF
jgi:metal-sulfur cluster biosynthetic enzyme